MMCGDRIQLKGMAKANTKAKEKSEGIKRNRKYLACKVSETGFYYSHFIEVAQIFKIGNNINI